MTYTSAPLRGMVKHPQKNSLNSDKKVNSKPSETGRSPLNRLRELEEKNAELEKQIRIEQSHSAFKLDRKEITDFYKFALEQEPKMLINLLVKEIQLFDDKMIIVYNTPRTISLDESQGFSFYTDGELYY